MQFRFYQPSCFRKDFKTTESDGPRTKVSKWPWPLVFIKVSFNGWLLKLTLLSLATTESEKFTVLPFSHTKPRRPNLTLLYNKPRSLKGHHLNRLDRASAINAAYQVSKSSAIQFLRRFSKVFTIYGCGGHLGHVAQT